jgi:hypothetical protein
MCPDLLRVPSGDTETQSLFLAEDMTTPMDFTALSRLLRSIGMPPQAIKHQEKNGIRNNSALDYSNQTNNNNIINNIINKQQMPKQRNSVCQ